ncbi:hypothetical protein GCM10009718_26590 [Isoptericola halotolerans]|uniref:Uncharacterized protein n=1 Tax=Isoptericola halotolerans TaxID=300560 RepID=A0ABX2A6R3_9MICO|nr:hypothetical protein [Isoptericola halotolerans]NOV97487.1 hypothetical protein [Isoptericola halotolerans]
MLRRVSDPGLRDFDRGCFVLQRDGEVAGHAATLVGEFWSPGRPLTIQQNVWIVVVWADGGGREHSFEDYPPWTVVSEIRGGSFSWDDGPRSGTYTATRLPDAEADARWAELEITPDDF